MTVKEANGQIDDFITRWSKSAGAERANFQGFAYELCELLGVARPVPSVSDADQNPYAFERAVKFKLFGIDQNGGHLKTRQRLTARGSRAT